MVFLNSSFIMQKLTSFFKPIENSAKKRKTSQEDIDTNESTEPSEPQQVKSRSSSSSKRTFQPDWKKMYPWLSYHRDGKMFCNKCLESPNLSNSGSSFVAGCDNFKIESLRSHAKSNGRVKEPRSPICLFLFGSCFLNEKWLFETLKEDVNHLQIVSGQEYIDLMRG